MSAGVAVRREIAIPLLLRRNGFETVAPVHLAALHDESDLLELLRVVERIARCRHQIRIAAGLYRSDPVGGTVEWDRSTTSAPAGDTKPDSTERIRSSRMRMDTCLRGESTTPSIKVPA
jgi:hypothetical protein